MIQVQVTVDDGAGVIYQYTMAKESEDLIIGFAERRFGEIVLVEEPPEIRRNFPIKLTIRRVHS